MVQRRNSKQRERIYTAVRESSSHPTAVQIYNTLREEMPNISLGNIYRNLKILTEKGLITCKDFGDGIEHYDAVMDNHYHFICNECKSVTDFTMPVRDDLTGIAQTVTGNTITGHTIQFFGICESCNKKRKSM